ncbi:MAG: HAMP domain-containing protein [Candidatus Cloacimonetes bacterium]|nr:HAMP domain-containing protein [Candidatus Cloacimonadota bacterium]
MRKYQLSPLIITSLLLLLLSVAVCLILKAPIWLTLFIVGLISLLSIFVLQHQINKIRKSWINTAHTIAQGEYNQRLPELGIKEVDEVAAVFNQMLERLEEVIHHLTIHRQELRLLLNSIEDALWAQDDEGRIIWANEPFQNLFPTYNPAQKPYYQEIIRHPELLASLEKTDASPEKQISEITLQNHSFLFSCSLNQEAKRKIFILHNIDAIRQTEQMKKDFIVNLAHELRTPMTAIQGFTEAMLSSPEQNHTRYLKIILNHSQRLNHLIGDLEQLIQLESTAQLELQDINLTTFFDNIRLILEPEIQEKKLNLEINLDPAIPRLVCDPFRLEQVFINLVQNSLRYTDKGTILIKSQKEGNKVIFEVSDTGTGIAPEHLSRIFERFYVADPSRSRSRNGTGLGLAIVKHIILLHHGDITVTSKLGEGTTFKLTLPQKNSGLKNEY